MKSGTMVLVYSSASGVLLSINELFGFNEFSLEGFALAIL